MPYAKTKPSRSARTGSASLLCDNCTHNRVSLVINGHAKARTANAIGFHAGSHVLWVPYSISTIEEMAWGFQVYVPQWFYNKKAHLIKNL